MYLLRPAAVAVFVLSVVPTPSFSISEIVDLDRAKRGNVAFTHRKHAYTYQVPCEQCHHNIGQITTGETTCKGCHMSKQHSGLCHQCHLSNRDDDYDERISAVQDDLEKDKIPNLFKAFHNLCRNCHADSNEEKKTAAPYECGGCHV